MIYIGKREPEDAYLGTKKVLRMYLGDVMLFPSTDPASYENFLVGGEKFVVTDDGGSEYRVTPNS